MHEFQPLMQFYLFWVHVPTQLPQCKQCMRNFCVGHPNHQMMIILFNNQSTIYKPMNKRIKAIVHIHTMWKQCQYIFLMTFLNIVIFNHLQDQKLSSEPWLEQQKASLHNWPQCCRVSTWQVSFELVSKVVIKKAVALQGGVNNAAPGPPRIGIPSGTILNAASL